MGLSLKAIVILATIITYFLVLILISLFTSKNSDKETFFNGNKKSPWFLVAFGMIGASLSGVTFISIPGWVKGEYFTYMQMVIGYVLGYIVIAEVLMPMYYKLKVTSIYEYLDQRFGFFTYKVGALYFILSRVVGASFRLFLVAGVLYLFVFSNKEFFPHADIPFWVSVLVTIVLIWVYTFKGGIKTIVYTDALQTFFMLLSLGISIFVIIDALDWSVVEAAVQLKESEYSNLILNREGSANWWLNIVSGMFITIVMTGLDQDMMQKNLTISNIKSAKKNMYTFAGILVVVNFFFLVLGGLLYLYVENTGVVVPLKTDYLFPTLSLNHFGLVPMVVFLLGIIAAAYSSADSALTALTTSFVVDIWGKQKNEVSLIERYTVHIGFSLLLFVVIVFFSMLDDTAVISQLFKAAGYTYGPLLGLFAFGLFTKRKVQDKLTWLVCVISPLLCFAINHYCAEYDLYKFGFEILLLNGGVTFLGLLFIQNKD